jgi:4-azaleucine resistance transporter AzlC
MKGEWAAGLRAGLPLTLGVAPFAAAFGLAAREAGLGAGAVGAMSLIVLAGSSQFLAVAMLKAGAAAPQIWLATLFLNSRHLLMAMVLLPRLAGSRWWVRAVAAHAISDEAFAVTSRESGAGAAFLIGAQSALAVAWIGGSLAGVILGAALPPALAEAAGFSLVGFFVAVVALNARGLPDWGAAAAGGGLALLLVGTLPRGWELIVAGICAAAIGAVLEARSRSGSRDAEAAG